MDSLAQDLKYVFRSLARRPGFTAAVLLTLGLGIAANTAIFSVVNGVLLQPLPFESPERLVTPDVMSTKGFYISTSIPNYYDWKDRSRSFESFGAYRGTSAVLTGLDRPEVIRVRQVLGDFFTVLGVDAARGRTITAQEAEPGAAALAVLSHNFWQEQLGGDPGVLGRSLSIDGEPFQVIGVMPEGFAFPSPSDDVYLPMGHFSDDLSWNARGSSSGTRAVARLLPGVSIDLAQVDLDRITTAIRETEDENAAAPILVSVTERYVGDIRAPLWMLMGAVAFVLLIACANVANLLLARGEGRQKELALRAALGANRHRVVRQLLTESLVLGLSGGLLGIGLAYVAVAAMEGALPTSLPALMVGRVSIDLTVLLFTLTLAVATGLIFGFVPALRSSRPDLLSTLKEGGRGRSVGGRHGMRGALVIAEVGAVARSPRRRRAPYQEPRSTPAGGQGLRRNERTHHEGSPLRREVPRGGDVASLQSGTAAANACAPWRTTRCRREQYPIGREQLGEIHLARGGSRVRPGKPPLRSEYHRLGRLLRGHGH